MSAPLDQGPRDARWVVVLAHGAGAPMDSPFMDGVADRLARSGLRVVRFEFPYMQRRRLGGRRAPPDRQPALLSAWHAEIDRLGHPERLVIGGKSMGGRIASMIADERGVAGLVCLGYPFHPPGKPDRLRTAHLTDLKTPALIVHGERDPFGSRDEIEGYGLPASIRVAYVPDGDHSLKPRVRSGRTLEDSLDQAAAEIGSFVEALQPPE